MLGDNKTLNLQGVYNTLYNAITRPDFKFVVTRYFIDEWAPLLGPSLAWLIVGLRQQCFWNRRRDWCIVDQATLARETALDKRTIERCLKKPLSRWFVIEVTHRYRYRSQIGRKVRDKNRYRLLLDDPLSPRHQIGLANLLRQVMPAKADPLAAGLAAVQTLLETPDLTGKISYTGRLPKTLPRRTILELVEEAAGLELSRCADDDRVVQLDQACARLYNLIVQPNQIYVGWQYFRLEWVRLLGHALAWLVIYMRRHCFWDQTHDELRDHFTTYKKDLAAAIGQSPRNLANLMDNPYAALFFTTPDADGDGAKRSQARNRPTTYQVRLVDEPLTPDDQHRLAGDLRRQLQGDFFGQDAENGQLNLFPLLDQLSGRQNFAYGQALEKPEKMSSGEAKKCPVDDDLSEKMSSHDSPATGKNVVTLKDSLRLSDSNKIQEQQRHPDVAVESKKVKLLLQDLSVQEPVRSKILANPDITVARIGGWFLYAETQPSLFDPRGYVIKRLLANDSPPPEFLAFAGLDDATWRLFEETATTLQQGQAPAADIGPDLLETFISWAEVYANLDPTALRRLLSRPDRPAPPDRSQPAEKGLSGAETVDPDLERARTLWQTTLAQLRLQMARQTFDTWLKQTEVVAYREGLFVIDARNIYAKEWLENRLAESVERTLSGVVGQATTVRFVLADDG